MSIYFITNRSSHFILQKYKRGLLMSPILQLFPKNLKSVDNNEKQIDGNHQEVMKNKIIDVFIIKNPELGLSSPL